MGSPKPVIPHTIKHSTIKPTTPRIRKPTSHDPATICGFAGGTCADKGPMPRAVCGLSKLPGVQPCFSMCGLLTCAQLRCGSELSRVCVRDVDQSPTPSHSYTANLLCSRSLLAATTWLHLDHTDIMSQIKDVVLWQYINIYIYTR